jgi:hypothetical protein
VHEASEATARSVRKMLGLNLEAKEFHLAFGAIQNDDQEIALVTCPVFEILMDESAGVEVSASDLQEGRVTKPAEWNQVPLPALWC